MVGRRRPQPSPLNFARGQGRSLAPRTVPPVQGNHAHFPWLVHGVVLRPETARDLMCPGLHSVMLSLSSAGPRQLRTALAVPWGCSGLTHQRLCLVEHLAGTPLAGPGLPHTAHSAMANPRPSLYKQQSKVLAELKSYPKSTLRHVQAIRVTDALGRTVDEPWAPLVRGEPGVAAV